MQKVIVNGANGYVASHFVAEMLNKGYDVVALVRDAPDSNAQQRMKKALMKVDTNLSFQNLKVFNYSLLQKNYSLSSKELTEIFCGHVDFFHFAASLKFKKREKEEIFKINVDGTKNSLKLFKEFSSEASRFFYISTVYSCGNISEPFKEKFYKNEGIENFRNYYEQSKRCAENLLRESIEKDKLNVHIIRLAQVVGDNRSGITQTDYGIFDFIKKLQKFSSTYPDEKVRIEIDPLATQNLIPIDQVVDYLVKVLKRKDLAVIFNFASRNPLKNSAIIDSVCSLLPVVIVPEKNLDKTILNRKERLIAKGMSFTGVYAKTHLEFDTTNLDKMILPNGNEVTNESLFRMIKFFVNHNSKKTAEKVTH